MRPHVQGIDHVVVLVRDLDKAQRAYQRMGFTLTPRGHHTLGSQNHCLMFGRDYVELLAVPRPSPAARKSL
jgi:catechol 2,3-dioxygenase-like lactoylglutathione lyase family enzyme